MLNFKGAFIGVIFHIISINAFSFIESKNYKSINLIAENCCFSSIDLYKKNQSLTLNALQSATVYYNNIQLINVLGNRIDNYTSLSNYQALANIYETSAILNLRNSNFDQAKSLLLQAFEMHKNQNNSKELLAVAHKISLLYYEMNDLEASLKFSNEAISLMEEFNNQKILFDLLIWKNNVLLAQGSAYQVENIILKQLLLMATKSGQKQQEWECFYQLGKSYLMQNKLIQSKWFFVQSLSLSETFNDKTPKIKSLLMLAKSKTKTNDYSLALQNLKSAEALSKRFNNKFERDITKQLAEVYKLYK